MRIFTAVRHSNNPSYFYGGLWSANFYPALRQLGHEIVESQVDLLPTSRFMHIKDDFTKQEAEARAQTTEQILSEVIREHNRKPIDIFLSYFYNAHFEADGFAQLRRIGVPSINFYCNSMYQFDHVAAIAAKVDFSWHPEKHARELYLKVGANPIWVQLGADPSLYSPRSYPNRVLKAAFVGGRYADRDRWLAALIKAGIPIDIYGNGWKRRDRQQSSASSTDSPADGEYLGRPAIKAGTALSYLAAARDTFAKHGLVDGAIRLVRQYQYHQRTHSFMRLCEPHARGFVPDVTEIFCKYQMTLNFSNVWADGRSGGGLISHVRLRDFEAPMAGASYITGYTEEIGEFYDLGQEIETYREQAELIDKVRFYLGSPTAAEKLRSAGRRRACREHTWVQRFRKLFVGLGLGMQTRTMNAGAASAAL